MRSALKYKYKPQIRDGEAIEVPNVRTIIVFKIEDPSKPADYTTEGCAKIVMIRFNYPLKIILIATYALE